MLQQVASVGQGRQAEPCLGRHDWRLKGELVAQQDVEVEFVDRRVQLLLLEQARDGRFIDFKLQSCETTCSLT